MRQHKKPVKGRLKKKHDKLGFLAEVRGGGWVRGGSRAPTKGEIGRVDSIFFGTPGSLQLLELKI